MILLAGERFRRRSSLADDPAIAREREYAGLALAGRHATGTRALRQREQAGTIVAGRRLATVSYLQAWPASPTSAWSDSCEGADQAGALTRLPIRCAQL